VSRPAIRRAARLGDGWQPLGLSPDALAQGIEQLRDELRACGRDPAQVPVSLALSLAEARPRRFALGTESREVVRHAKAFAALGLDTLIVSATTSAPKEARAALEMIGREVVPAVSGLAA
jgi:alkanesulfonate monooxygenase SsuD/methylene tetrahydromethanopterin reductase-like flavin-dependent oxidoreductase (luciferase family)